MADKDFKVKQGIDLGTPLPVSEGGTGQTSATNALNSLLPVQASQSGKILETDGTNVSWVTKPVEYKRGNTASRPGSPTAGDIYVNTETGFIEIYTGATYGWEQVGGVASTVTGVTATNQGTSRAYNNGQASIAFTPGTILGRSYTATSSPGGFTGTASSSPITITGLQSSTQYTYTVTATNNYGTSAASAASAGVTATTVPQAPTIGTVTVSADVATIPFTPGATGGEAATYTATSSPGGLTGTSSSSPITISGLTDGQSYTFTVTATNSNGTSQASSTSNSVTISLDTGGMFPIGVFTLGSSSSSVTFSNIPQTYKHLEIRSVAKETSAANGSYNLRIRFNGDSGANYTIHRLFGNGTSATSDAFTSTTSTIAGNVAANGFSNVQGAGICQILDYNSTGKLKTVKTLSGADTNSTDSYIFNTSGLWLSTSAITSITLITDATSLAAGSMFALYGVKS